MKSTFTFILHNLYIWDWIEKFAIKYNLFVRNKDNLLLPFCDLEANGEIGEITMPLYFESGEVAVNFILTGYSTLSQWRCIYICQTFSSFKKHEI